MFSYQESDLQPTAPRDRSEIFPEDYHYEGYIPRIDNWKEYCKRTNRDPFDGRVLPSSPKK